MPELLVIGNLECISKIGFYQSGTPQWHFISFHGGLKICVPTRGTADGYSSYIIASRFRVYSGQARAASLAVTVQIAAPADLLRHRARVALASCMLAQVGRSGRCNFLY